MDHADCVAPIVANWDWSASYGCMANCEDAVFTIVNFYISEFTVVQKIIYGTKVLYNSADPRKNGVKAKLYSPREIEYISLIDNHRAAILIGFAGQSDVFKSEN